MNPYITATVTVLGMISTFIFSYLAFRSRDKKATRDEARHNGAIASDIGYIRAGVDDLKRENRKLAERLGGHSERITRCEESCKQAHLRIDGIKKG